MHLSGYLVVLPYALAEMFLNCCRWAQADGHCFTSQRRGAVGAYCTQAV